MSKGLQPNRMIGGSPNSTGLKAYRVANSYGTALANGDPVALSNGTVVKYQAGNNALGVVTGFKWIDPTTKRPVYHTVLPAGTSSGGVITGDNRPVAFVADSPDQTFKVQARASLAVSASNIGALYTLSLAAPNLTQGYSNVVLDAVATSLDQAAVRLIGLVQSPTNAYDVSGNEAEVVFVRHVYNT